MKTSERPLSPHLGIYRWYITMALSIFHRATGVANALGLVTLTVWLVQVAAGPEAYQRFAAILGAVPGRIALIGWTLTFFYHCSNGIRHLVSDTGRGLEIPEATRSAYIVLTSAVVLTAAFWSVLLWL